MGRREMDMGRSPVWSAMEGLDPKLNLDVLGKVEKEGGG